LPRALSKLIGVQTPAQNGDQQMNGGGEAEQMQVLIGTSGFSYPAWRGSFYPEKMPVAKMLAYYAERLAAVEINNTFYRMPQSEVLERWAGETPAGFRFAIKSPRQITHEKKLLDVKAAVDRLAEAARALGDKLGPVLFQLPPFLRKDLARLNDFLAAMPAGLSAALEFRHTSWFSDDVYASLRSYGAALCIAESEEVETPLEATAGWGYLRLRRQDYDEAAIGRWAERIKTQSWSSAYVFFKHEDAGKGPKAAARLREMLG
jgi:uncharacterized protein YecE (DUF72 family)